MLKVNHKVILNILRKKRNFTHNVRSLGTEVNEDGSKEFKINTPWGHIAGKKWGPNGGRKVLAVHGVMDNAGTWDTLVPLLNKDLEIFAIDLPGHGRSSYFPKGLMNHPAEFLPVIHRVVKTLSLDKFIYLGHSLGSILGYAYIATFPELVDQYIAIENMKPVTVPPSLIMKMNRKAVDGVLKIEKTYNSEKLFEGYTLEEAAQQMVKGYDKSLTLDSAHILLKRGLKPAPGNSNKFVFSRDPKLKLPPLDLGVTTENLQRFGSYITCDVLHIKAFPGMELEHEPIEVYRQTVDMLRKNASSVTYHEVDGTHHLHLNTPERVAPLINTFVRV